MFICFPTELGGAVQLMGIIRLLIDPENMLGTTNVCDCIISHLISSRTLHINDIQYVCFVCVCIYTYIYLYACVCVCVCLYLYIIVSVLCAYIELPYTLSILYFYLKVANWFECPRFLLFQYIILIKYLRCSTVLFVTACTHNISIHK